MAFDGAFDRIDVPVVSDRAPSASSSLAASKSYIVKPETLTRWNRTISSGTSSTHEEAPSSTSSRESKFPHDEKLNRKLILWQGNLCDLAVDAIVNTTNERLNEQLGISGTIFQRAGPDLPVECMKTEGCHTGEAVITKGYLLPASYIIHTVGPRFSVKYQTAAENALHGCYRRCLELLKENGLESIAFPLVNTDRKGYPKENAAHIAIRTVRRFLEKYGSSIHTIIFCMETSEDVKLYNRILPLYFPRDPEEEARVASLLPRDTGNDLGESVIADRKIRIGVMPGMSNEDDLPNTTIDDMAPYRRATFPVSPSEDPFAEEKQEEKDKFGSMQDNPDIKRRNEIGNPKDDAAREEIERRYAEFLLRASQEDLGDMKALNFIYPAGNDNLGRPIIVFVAKNLPATSSASLDRVLLYMIKLLDPIVNGEYTVIYFHSLIESNNKPPFSWLRQVYEIFNRKYKKNLKRLIIVHPTFWVKVVLLFATPFISKKFWRKVSKVEKLKQLFDEFDAQALNVEEAIVKHDQTLNPSDYAAQFDKPADQPAPAGENSQPPQDNPEQEHL